MRRILSGHLNNKGVTLITLIIAITIFAIFITVFSYVMVAKHGSSALYVQSTQAYAVAQAGIEYGIRYAIGDDDGVAFFADPASLFPVTDKDFGDGSFTLIYNDPDNPNALTSKGKVGVAERVIILQNFASWVTGGAITPVPGGDIPYQDPVPAEQKNIVVPTLNNYAYDIYIDKIELAKEGGNPARLDQIKLGGTTVWTGNKVNISTNSDSSTLFSFNEVAYYTMASGASLDRIEVQATSEVRGTWYLTFWYSKQSDLSDPQSSLITFTIP